jgi:hypothetical protein
MALPPLTPEVVRRLERAFADFTVRRLDAYAALPDEGVEIARFGAAVAPVCPPRKDLDFLNRVANLWSEDADRVPEIVAFYRGHGVRPWFELAPEPDFGRLASALDEAGATQVGFHGAFYGVAEPDQPEGNAVAVRRVPAEEAEAVGRVILEGLGAPPEAWTAGAATLSGTGAHLYEATIEDEPAAGAALSISDGVAYLALAATRPMFRGHGCQLALIRRRIADAAAQGCRLVGALAEFDSASQRNLQRAGLQVAYTKAVWRLR